MQLRRNTLTRRFGVPTLVGLLAGSALTLSPTAPPALAAAGDYSYAHAQFLQGSLLDLADLSAVVEIEGEQAESDGTASDGPHYNNLELALLDAIELPLGSTLGEIPLGTGAGVVGQYANATADSFSLAGAGAITNNGVIGTPDGPPPQPMEVDLGDLVDAASASATPTGLAASPPG